MADVKISALPALSSAALTDLFAVVQGGVTYKGTLTQVVAAIPDADGSTRGLVTTGTQTFAGTKTFSQIDVTGTARIQERLTVSQDNTVATQVVSVINTDTANCGMVIAPSGTGAIMAQVPDGTVTGGNARGGNAVDLQIVRSVNTQVASGVNSVIVGGENNTASSINSLVVGGELNTASGSRSAVCGGNQNIASGVRSFVGGGENNVAASAFSSILGGSSARADLVGQSSNASGRFAANSDAQTSNIRYRRSITGTAQTELFLDGASVQAILNISSPGPTNARAWRAQVDVVAIVATAGGGGLVQNECFMGSYLAGIKRVGATTSLVGTVATVNEVSDTNMATAVVTIDADDTNEALRIQFTPPSTADGSTVIRVVATAYLTEVGR